MRYIMLGAFLLLSPTADAKTLKMFCNNGTHDFVATFNEATRSFAEDDTKYRVLGVDKSGGLYTVFGLTVNDGPAFRATFRPQRKVEYFEKSKLFQTDQCR